ncbi:uncharacterized protein [Nicotiana sylvestris]|uniref:uncharacterized protein n=1 Tax=Nicotiana sylvestris TaxID=4096 RepID=UPI00388CEB34
MVPAPGASPLAQPARGRGQTARGRGQAARGQAARGGGQLARARPRDIVQSGGSQPRCYAFPARPEVESFDAIITGYYHRFVEWFSSIATPLTRLTQKGSPFRWSDKCEASFQKLKTTLTTTPVVVLPIGSGSYTVYCDVSRIGLGAVLMKDGKALANQFVRLDVSEPSHILACTVTRSSLFERIRERQYDESHLLVLRDMVRHGDAKKITVGDDRVLRIQGYVCVPNVDGLRELILEEAHNSRYFIHSSTAKMYQDLRQHYWWRRMKKYIIAYAARCLNCQQILEWKWEHITMDFIDGLPRTQRKFDAVWVIVDRLTKSAHFILVAVTYSLERWAEIYIREIVRLHDVPVSIISD